MALNDKELDANFFQHKPYLGFSTRQNRPPLKHDFKWAAVSRSSTLGSPLSIASDALDTLGIKKNYRTTSGSSRYEHKVSDPNQAFWKAVSQTPTLDTFSSIWDNGKGYIDRGITEKNLRDTARIVVPANQNWKILLSINAALETYKQVKPLPKK